MRLGHRLRATLLLVVALSIATPAGAVFDKIDLSPRARGLGGAYAGLSDQADGIFYNPAGLANAGDYELYGSVFELWSQSFLRVNVLSIAIPTAKWGTIAVGYNDLRVEYDNNTLSIERTARAAHGFTLMEDLTSTFSFGYALNLYNLEYPAVSVSGVDLGSETTFGIDLGVMIRLYERTTAGVYVKNINSPTIGKDQTTDLPQIVGGGLAYRPYEGVITAVDIERQQGEDVQFKGGVEFEVAKALLVRFGAQSKPSLFNVGAGLRLAMLRVDATYTHHPVLQPTLQVGLGAQF